jgi:hypothetical protein
MYAPDRRKSSYSLNDWARNWLSRGDGWECRIYELADYNPILYRQLVDECTIVEVAHAWKTKMAMSEFAWSDTSAIEVTPLSNR